MAEQLSLFVELAPTIAIGRGDASVWQCAQCGALVCHPQPKKPAGDCASCGHPAGPGSWWSQELPVGAFRSVELVGAPA